MVLFERKAFSSLLTLLHLYPHITAQREFVISKQLLRSGTSIGANIEEATSAASRRDFLAKMTIALKEARETLYWLRLLNESDLVTVHVSSHLVDCNELIRILAAIVKTTSANLEKSQNPNVEMPTLNSELCLTSCVPPTTPQSLLPNFRENRHRHSPGSAPAAWNTARAGWGGRRHAAARAPQL